MGEVVIICSLSIWFSKLSHPFSLVNTGKVGKSGMMTLEPMCKKGTKEPRIMHLGNAGDKCGPVFVLTSCGFSAVTLVIGSSHSGEGRGKEP